MHINLIIIVLFLGVFVGYISGVKTATEGSRNGDGEIIFDTRNDSGMTYKVLFDTNPKSLLEKKKLSFRVRLK